MKALSWHRSARSNEQEARLLPSVANKVVGDAQIAATVQVKTQKSDDEGLILAQVCKGQIKEARLLPSAAPCFQTRLWGMHRLRQPCR